MRYIILVTSFTFLIALLAKSQPANDSTNVDSAKYFSNKAAYYFFKNADSSLQYAVLFLEKASELNNYALKVGALNLAGEGYRETGNFPRSLEMQLKALRLNRLNRDKNGEVNTYRFIGFTFLDFGDYRRALTYLLPTDSLARKKARLNIEDSIMTSFACSNLALCYALLGKTDSADYFNQESLSWLGEIKDRNVYKLSLRQFIIERLGQTDETKGKFDEALHHYRLALYYAFTDTLTGSVSIEQKNLANIFEQLGNTDSAIFYARNALLNSQLNRQLLMKSEAADILNKIYRKQGKTDSALYYYSIAMSLRDSVFGVRKFNELQILMLNEQEEQQKLVAEKTQQRNTLRLSLVAVAAVAFFVVALILRRNNRAKQVINRQLEEQKRQLENTLMELKSTQSQLIQSEKMASLGELTAGIAHEIQNPLNFVNNFSEVNRELLHELKDGIEKGNLADAKTIAASIIDNEEKISHHGKRADSIVKGMLQHSRTSTGQNELTDLNALCDEYLRLSCHGMSARDKNFNAALETDFDSSIGKISVVPQEIGRVLVNLFNNAFYAVNEKKKQLGEDYMPTVTVITRNYSPLPSAAGGLPQAMQGGQRGVEITVKDNGNGIPEKIREKIFQPFFTTKAAGEGTGLGLSLAYDIIVKGHGGKLEAVSTPSSGAAFTILLPIGD